MFDQRLAVEFGDRQRVGAIADGLAFDDGAAAGLASTKHTKTKLLANPPLRHTERVGGALDAIEKRFGFLV